MNLRDWQPAIRPLPCRLETDKSVDPPLSGRARRLARWDSTGLRGLLLGGWLISWLLAFLLGATGGGAAVALAAAIFGLACAGGYLAFKRMQVTPVKAGNRWDHDLSRWLEGQLQSLYVSPPPTLPESPEVWLVQDLRLGEVERHFDSQQAASITGWLQHQLAIRGFSVGLPVGGLDLGIGRFRAMGSSRADLALSGTMRDELIGEGFIAVLEMPSSSGMPDTLRLVVPSDAVCRAYVSQLLETWSAQLGPETYAGQVLARYSAALAHVVQIETSYVSDRLAALLRLPAGKRPRLTALGVRISEHAMLAGALRFGQEESFQQLFPVALVQALIEAMGQVQSPSLSTPSLAP
jgi:hypothetical protein